MSHMSPARRRFHNRPQCSHWTIQQSRNQYNRLCQSSRAREPQRQQAPESDIAGCCALLDGRSFQCRQGSTHWKETLPQLSTELVPMRQTDLKIIILGALRVGKTSILHRYIHNNFYEDYRCTMGANIQQKGISVNGQAVKLQVWDTGAQERFRSMVSLFYRGLDGCILTFDLTDRDTFRELDGWRQSILEQSQAADADLPFIVLGNKADVRDRQVSRAEAEAWCDERNLTYFEVSAKESINVEKAFTTAASYALCWHKEKLVSNLTDSIKLKEDNKGQKTCCA